jgi:branched-chain amino acid transport system permease protein
MGWISNTLQYLISGLAVGSTYAIVALGFTIIFSSTAIVNFAQGEFVMLGAMVSYWLINADNGPHLAVFVGVPLAIVIATVIGILLGWVLLRPRKDASPVSLIIITVGASMLLQGIASNQWGKDAVAVKRFTEVDPPPLELGQIFHNDTLYPVCIQSQEIWVMGLTLLLVIILTLFFNKTMVGKALRAVAVNKHGARLVGINVSRLVMGAFALSAAMGALAGAAIGPISSGSYSMGAMMGLKGFAAAIVGGLGNFSGSFVAGLLLGVLENVGVGFLPAEFTQYKDAFAFVILLLVLFISPNGIFALWRKRTVRG